MTETPPRHLRNTTCDPRLQTDKGETLAG